MLENLIGIGVLGGAVLAAWLWARSSRGRSHWRRLPAFPLAAVVDPELIVPTIAAALRIPLVGSGRGLAGSGPELSTADEQQAIRRVADRREREHITLG